jgi:hypothetical protein
MERFKIRINNEKTLHLKYSKIISQSPIPINFTKPLLDRKHKEICQLPQTAPPHKVIHSAVVMSQPPETADVNTIPDCHVRFHSMMACRTGHL